jgi:hypothetical protein
MSLNPLRIQQSLFYKDIAIFGAFLVIAMRQPAKIAP